MSTLPNLKASNPYAEAKKNGRRLNSAEIFLIPASFRTQIDVARILLINHHQNIFAKNKIMTRNYDIWWPDCPEDFTKIEPSSDKYFYQSTLMHELCHVWQYKTGRLSLGKYITNPARWKYRYKFDPKKRFDDYPTEKQADLFQDWWLANMDRGVENYDKSGIKPTKEQLNKVIPFQWSPTSK